MSLRFLALVYSATLKFAKKPLVILLLVLNCPVYPQSPSSNEDLKKQAAKLFEEEDYPKAYKLYSQLVSNFPKDPVYNYRLGVCMIYAEPDKKKCLSYLKFAAANSADNKDLKEVLFYLGKANHINYRFDEAIKNYNDFKLGASASQIKKLQVDQEIKACGNGKHLLSNLTDLEVISKSQLSENDYFRNYKKVGGKLLVKPDEFKTATDKKKKEKSVVFLPNGSDVVYFSSYGEDPATGKDIYTASRQANGVFSKPQKVIGINTELDEDYPFLHPDGKTLYFASKGYNSMGGYDIFKSIFNEETNTWSSPVNMEFPINSPDDDFLFVTDSLETTAYFSTGRQSPPGKIDVLKVKTKRRPIDIIALKGSIIPGTPEYGLKSTINVKDIFTQNELGTYTTENDGSYTMELPNGGKLLFTVETPGLETQSAQVSIPLASAAKNYKQTISYEKGKLKILNYFDEVLNDNSYLQYLNVIEKKARLDVNETDAAAPPLAANTTNPQPTAEQPAATQENKTEPAAEPAANPDPKAGMDNKELANLARQDANESKQEAAQLHRDFLAANETGLKQKEEADKKATEASDALFKAETISDPVEKKAALESANALKLAAENDQALAAKILKLAQSLDEDSKAKEKEANLNAQYATELEKTIKSKDPKASSAKLEELQKQIADQASKKNASENMVSELKTDIEQKEKQIAEVEQVTTTVKANREEIKTAIADKEAELAKTRKKSAKKELSAQIEELKTEQDEKTKQIDANDTELKTLNEELAASKNQLEIATKITSEKASVPESVKPVVAQKVDTKSLQEKYKDKIFIADPESRSSVEESSVQLNNFNKELDQLISKDRSELAKTKNKDVKAKLSAEIKQAEAAKKQNQSQIAGNNARLTELNKAPKPEVAKTTFDPITAESSSDAVSKLEKLDTQLNANDNENFDYNGYQNPAAQNLKIEADAKINDAIAKQKKLKDDIAASKQELQKSSPSITPQQLSKEGDDLLAQAQKTKGEANSKSGAEKTRLVAEARQLEDQANAKFIEASEVTRADNSAIVAANQENIQNLINDGKSTEQEVEQAKALNEEAKAAYRKAADIRVEGNSLGNAGGKLGSFSNAEEKEAEAILKQQQAIAILVKSNPTLALKTPVTSSSAPSENTGAPVDLGAKLQVVNSGLTDLATIKIESYQKLYDANEAEINQLLSDIKDNQATVDNTPSLKTTYISGNNKLDAARTLKQSSDNATNPNEKLSNLIASNKKQTEAIKQFNTVRASLNPAPASPAVTTTPTAEPAVTSTTETPVSVADDPFFNDTPATSAAQATTETVVQDDLGLLSEIDTRKIDVDDLAQTDTTATQLVSYFDNTPVALRNPQASTTVKSSLNQLKDYEAQQSTIDSELNKVAADPGAPAVALNTQELNSRADVLNDEADVAGNKASELRKEAQSKEGTEKEALLSQAKELEAQSQDKMIEAADFRQQANEGEYKTNTNSISDLINKLKADNPTLAAEMEAKREELGPLKTQINNLRTEANALSNKAAKLGAISNAEEKELELIQKQNTLLTELKKQYPDYVATAVTAQSPEEKTAELQQKKSQLRDKQYSELTNLTNGFSLEYESSKNNVPSNLSAEQKAVKANAEELNAESKRLLIQSSQEKNDNEKIKLLTLAAKTGNAAVEKLNKVLPKFTPSNDDLGELGKIGSEINDANSSGAEPSNVKTSPKKPQPGAVKIDGLEVVRGNAYSAANPIPINARMEDGLIFRVQIGAFKTQLPNNAFKGLSPLNGETTSSGYIRYTAGNFYKVESANAVKNDLRNLGYSDAFVVVYLNGRRITLAEALAEMERQGKKVDPNAPQTAGITANVNVPKAAVNPVMIESVTVSKELEQTDGLLYTIQIGVYTKEVNKSQILSLRPIFREQLSNGLYRYTAGIYNNPERLLADKNRVVSMGIRDAFVSAYLNGKRVPFAEARDRQASNDATLKVQAENPIIFPQSTTPAADPLEKLLVSTVTPFKNEVTNYPAPTPENGVKTTEEGICYKVQIGAFSKQVPDDVAAMFSAIRTWPIDNKKINGLFIYNIGNFADANNAKRLKDEAVRLGISDAFVTVYRDGKKLYGPEAEGYLR